MINKNDLKILLDETKIQTEIKKSNLPCGLPCRQPQKNWKNPAILRPDFPKRKISGKSLFFIPVQQMLYNRHFLITRLRSF